MFANEFDPESPTEDLVDYPEELEDYPSEDWDEGEYLDPGDPLYSSDSPGYYPSNDYPPGDYQTAYSPPDDIALGPLPKFLFFCTIVACLILAVGLSLVTIRLPPAGSRSDAQSQTGAASQPQADATQPVGPDNTNCAVSQRFPVSIRRWCGLITQYAGKHDLPPDLLAALIWQESGGNPVAYSRSGAVGLMQVMPSDGLAAGFQCINGPCFSSRPSTDELKDPEFNVSYGTRMLAGLVGKTGNLREALKSYGPANVGYYYADKVLGIYQSYSN